MILVKNDDFWGDQVAAIGSTGVAKAMHDIDTEDTITLTVQWYAAIVVFQGQFSIISSFLRGNSPLSHRFSGAILHYLCIFNSTHRAVVREMMIH